MRIVFIGASLTEGIYGGNYVKRIAELLPDYEIINHAVSGTTLNRQLEAIDKTIEAQPDAVFIMVGSNDAIAYSQPETRPYYKSQQKLPNGFHTPEEFGQLYRTLLEKLQLHYIRPLIALPPLEHNPELVEASNLFNQQSVEAGRAYNAPILDLSSQFVPENVPARPPLTLQSVLLIGDRLKQGWKDYDGAKAQTDYTYSFDGLHFTEAAAEKAAGIIAPWLREQLG